MKFDELTKRHLELVDATKTFWDNQDAKGEEPTLAEKEQIKDLNKELEQVEGQLSESKQYHDMRAAHMGKSAELDKPVRTVPFPNGNGGQPKAQVKTVGAQFTQDFPEFKEWLHNLSPSGQIPESMRVGQSPAMPFDAKALITGLSDTSGGAMVRTDYAALASLPFRPLTLRDIITVGRTTSDVVEYPRVTGYTNNAAPVAEATTTSGGTGAKPESDMTLEKITTTVKTVAHWIPATKRALSDAGQIETLINAFLNQGLEEELEDQMITGDGTGENFAGIDSLVTTAQAWSTSLLETTRKARTKVRTTGRANATAYLLHPDDWERIDLLQDNEARYYFGGPAILGSPRIWGLPVVESEGVPTGKGWCGDFKQLVLWDREQATIRVSDSHSDFFVRNLVAILAELRAAFGVFRPAALVEMDLTA